MFSLCFEDFFTTCSATYIVINYSQNNEIKVYSSAEYTYDLDRKNRNNVWKNVIEIKMNNVSTVSKILEEN